MDCCHGRVYWAGRVGWDLSVVVVVVDVVVVVVVAGVVVVRALSHRNEPLVFLHS